MMSTEDYRLDKNVQISQISDTVVNPQPVKLDDNNILDDFLSPRRLRALTGVEDLEEVTQLEMQVDTGEASLGNFGAYLPNLRQLKLSNSIIPSVRDLGSSLYNLQVLWLPQCCLENLDGITTMSALQELYLCYNELKDVSACGMLENLEILDLEGNYIDDLHNVMYLSMCAKLKRLSLEGNPVCTKPSPDENESGYNYRQEVLKIMPQLEHLDDIPVAQADSARQSGADFDDHWRFINNLLLESGLVAATSSDSLDTSGVGSTLPSSARPRGATPGSSVPPRPQSGLRLPGEQKRLMTARGCPGTANRPRSAIIRPGSSTSNASLEEMVDHPEESSLTAGQVVCGNISKALRKRPTGSPSDVAVTSPLRPQTSLAIRGVQSADNGRIVHQSRQGPGRTARVAFSNPPSALPPRQPQPVKRITDTEAFDLEHSAILNELKSWKLEYEKSLNRVKQEREPQVLQVFHDEAIELSEDSEPETASPLPLPPQSPVRRLPELRPHTAGALGTRLRRQLPPGAGLLPSKPVLRP